ncbi:MAG: hypothetical protein HY726_04395 [Candidatus Rokubacteria bacterium]|nr:hypothetical protein [Candidatus Rokubacteria bacterium]
MVLLLRPQDHAGLLTMDEAIEAVEAGFRALGVRILAAASAKGVGVPLPIDGAESRDRAHEGPGPATG